jgi:hypothetical protein
MSGSLISDECDEERCPLPRPRCCLALSYHFIGRRYIVQPRRATCRSRHGPLHQQESVRERAYGSIFQNTTSAAGMGRGEARSLCQLPSSMVMQAKDGPTDRPRKIHFFEPLRARATTHIKVQDSNGAIRVKEKRVES